MVFVREYRRLVSIYGIDETRMQSLIYPQIFMKCRVLSYA